MKYKVIVKTSSNNKNRVHNCLATWLKGLDYVCLTDNLTGEFNEISGSKRTDYYSAEEKTVFFINHVKDNNYDEYDWLAFIDDDAILNIKMFEYILPYMNKDYVYGLKMRGSYEKAPNTVYPSGGSGYFISPSLIKKHNYMIDNKWGVEDASVGRWLEQNNIPLEDHLDIDGKRVYLKLNGWFPFQKERNQVSQQDINNEKVYPIRILENISDPEQKLKDINSCMTHHYIRWKPLMVYIHDCFQLWKPENLNT
jgi:hypothetical protein